MTNRFTSNPSGPGWQLTIQPFGKGAGYRAIDLPWHSNNRNAPRWRSAPWVSYIPGYTFKIIRNAKVRYMNGLTTRTPLWVSFTSNGNYSIPLRARTTQARHQLGRQAFPGWW